MNGARANSPDMTNTRGYESLQQNIVYPCQEAERTCGDKKKTTEPTTIYRTEAAASRLQSRASSNDQYLRIREVRER